MRSFAVQHRCNTCRYQNRRFTKYPCTQGDYELRRGNDCSFWKPIPFFKRLFMK